MKYLTLTILVFGGIVYGSATPAHADVSAACWEHLGSVETANTPAADRRYHLERGEPSPCTEYDAQQGSNQSNRKVDNQPKEQYNDEPKQRKRYDSPGWGCKLTWKGYRCG